MRAGSSTGPERREFERSPSEKCTIVFREDNRETHTLKEAVVARRDEAGFSWSWELFKALVQDIEGLVEKDSGQIIECAFDEDGRLADCMIEAFSFQERIDIANRAYGIDELGEEEEKNSE